MGYISTTNWHNQLPRLNQVEAVPTEDLTFKLNYSLQKLKQLKTEANLFKSLFYQLCKAQTPAEREVLIEKICFLLDLSIEE